MVQVNGAYKHGMYGKIWFNSLCVMFNIKVFATHSETKTKIVYLLCLSAIYV